MNYDRIGKYLAVIEGGKQKDKIICVSSDPKDEVDSFNSLKLTGDAKFQHYPDPNTERQIIYITGPSGSGKSTYTANYVKKYKKLFKKNQVYVFSALKDDESLDVIDPKRVLIDEQLVTDPIPIEEFADSLVIFDDIDVISDKKQREAVYTLLNQILETGRHHKISCVITNHLPTAGKDTRRVLNECHSVVYFPHSGSAVALKRLLCDYLGLDPKDMKRIKKANSRWCCVFKNYPQIVMLEKEIYKLSEEDDD